MKMQQATILALAVNICPTSASGSLKLLEARSFVTKMPRQRLSVRPKIGFSGVESQEKPQSATSIDKSFLIDFSAAAVAAAASKTINAPINRGVTLLQTNYELVRQNRLDVPYKGIVDCFKRTYQQEGLWSLWRGNTISIARSALSPAISFAFKDTFRQMFKADKRVDGYGLWFTKNIVAGALAGATSLLFLYPLDLGYIKRTTDVLSPHNGSTRKHGGVVSIWKDVLKNDGATGLYRGIGISVAGIALYRGLYFGLYDGLKPILLDNNPTVIKSFLLGWGVTFTAGMATYPVQVIKNRLIVTTGGGLTYKNSLHLAREIMVKEGVRGFYRGFVLQTALGVGGAAALAGYDFLKNKATSKGQ